VLADRGTGFILVEWMQFGVRLQRFDLTGHVVTSYGAGPAFGGLLVSRRDQEDEWLCLVMRRPSS